MSDPFVVPRGLRVAGQARSGRGAPIAVYDPSTGREIAELNGADASDVDDAVGAARAALAGEWGASSPAQRARTCRRVAALLLESEDELVEIGMRGGGLPRTLARTDVTVAARYFEYYGSVVEAITGETLPGAPSHTALTVREPWGVCGIVAPFNFPLQLSARDMAPALATGNAVVVKPAEQTPFGPLALVDLCHRAGLPAGVLNAATGLGAEAGQALVDHPDVGHVTFTGSVATGIRVMRSAAARVCPTTIELGGKSPHVVFADADLERVAAAVVRGAMRPAGQACSAGTRVLVQEGALTELRDRLGRAVRALVVAAADADPDVGPLASAEQQERVERAVRDAESAGAETIRAPLDVLDAATVGGYFVTPTLVTDVPASATVVREEVFGPVVALQPFADEDEAVAMANDTPFGLVAGVWTRDGARALRCARRIQAGQVFVNGFGVGGGVELPFGGYKRSGIGRAKGLVGALGYTQLKTISIDLT